VARSGVWNPVGGGCRSPSPKSPRLSIWRLDGVHLCSKNLPFIKCTHTITRHPYYSPGQKVAEKRRFKSV
jgi:hypothetical protein